MTEIPVEVEDEVLDADETDIDEEAESEVRLARSVESRSDCGVGRWRHLLDAAAIRRVDIHEPLPRCVP